jgi:hypothetical protein
MTRASPEVQALGGYGFKFLALALARRNITAVESSAEAQKGRRFLGTVAAN